MEKEIIEYADQIRQDISNGEYKEGDYCVIVYKTRGNPIPTMKAPKSIYKNVDEFEKKAPEEITSIPPEFGVQLEVWLFD